MRSPEWGFDNGEPVRIWTGEIEEHRGRHRLGDRPLRGLDRRRGMSARPRCGDHSRGSSLLGWSVGGRGRRRPARSDRSRRVPHQGRRQRVHQRYGGVAAAKGRRIGRHPLAHHHPGRRGGSSTGWGSTPRSPNRGEAWPDESPWIATTPVSGSSTAASSSWNPSIWGGSSRVTRRCTTSSARKESNGPKS